MSSRPQAMQESQDHGPSVDPSLRTAGWRRWTQIRVKHALDRVLAVLLILVLSPLLLLIGLAIKLDDRGPVFFRQARAGLGGKPFQIWKFRTMVRDADRFLNAAGSVGQIDRITRVGRLLRVLSLDELPQLFNIAVGEMSFVGPRPVLLEHVARYSAVQRRRLEMKPGITGLAQVNGRNTLRWTARIAHDVAYVDGYCSWLDLKILLRTVKAVLVREGIVLDRNPEQVDDLPRPPTPSADLAASAKLAGGFRKDPQAEAFLERLNQIRAPHQDAELEQEGRLLPTVHVVGVPDREPPWLSSCWRPISMWATSTI